MNEDARANRERILGILHIYARAAEQYGWPIDELFFAYFDVFTPKNHVFINAFTYEDLLDLCELYGRVCVAWDKVDETGIREIIDLQKLPEWRRVMEKAKELESRIGKLHW